MGVRLAVVSTWPEGRPAKLVYELEQERIVIGRRRGSDVHLPHPAVSGHHATISSQSSGFVVTDEGSTNGTRVNGTRVPPGRPKTLRSGDVIEVGGFQISVSLGVAIADATSADRTAALARQIVGAVLGQTDDTPEVIVLNGPNEGASARVPLPPARLVIGRGERPAFRCRTPTSRASMRSCVPISTVASPWISGARTGRSSTRSGSSRSDCATATRSASGGR